MPMSLIDVSKCKRADKEVVEGFCLSYDLVKGTCLETMESCTAALNGSEGLEPLPDTVREDPA